MSLLWKLPPFYSTAGRGCCRVWWGMAACGVQTPGCVNIQALRACGGRVHSSASTRHLLLLHYNPHALAHGAVHRIASTRHCRIVKRPRRGRIHIQPHALAHGVFRGYANRASERRCCGNCRTFIQPLAAVAVVCGRIDLGYGRLRRPNPRLCEYSSALRLWRLLCRQMSSALA